jgi:hypothetical protein
MLTFPEDFDGGDYDLFLKNFVLGSTQTAYIFHFLDFAPKTKRRSYRKIFFPYAKNPDLQPTDYIQTEIDFPNNYSLFACVIKINEQNIDYCLSHYRGMSSLKVISDNPFIFTEEFLHHTVKKAVHQPKKYNGLWTMDYLQFVLEYCQKGTFTFHTLVDGGDQIYWKVVVSQEDMPHILPLIEKTAREFELSTIE